MPIIVIVSVLTPCFLILTEMEKGGHKRKGGSWEGQEERGDKVGDRRKGGEKVGDRKGGVGGVIVVRRRICIMNR